MANSETLKEALTKTGNAKEADMLTHQAQNLTKDQVTDILNGKSTAHLSQETLSSLRKLAKDRISKGQPVLPWPSMDLDKGDSDDNMGGGIW